MIYFWGLALILSCSLTTKAQEPFIDWENIENPVYQQEDWSTKDASVHYHEKNKKFHQANKTQAGLEWICGRYLYWRKFVFA